MTGNNAHETHSASHPSAGHDSNCIFCKIIAGQIPSRKIYEDEDCYAFHDINPAAPVHFLIVPKAHIESLNHLEAEHAALLGRMLALAPKLAAQQGCRPGREGGFRVLINSGVDGGQEVFHLHIHIMGGQRPWKRG
jgi:histidine triad (HIT) family protein